MNVQLIETRSARIVWADTLKQRPTMRWVVLDEIGNRIVASIAHQVEPPERNRAVLKPPNSLDAWEAHHRGLWHMYRFNRDDNVQARHFFETALELDPTFSRPTRGCRSRISRARSSAGASAASAIEPAYEAAGRGLMADEHDPAAHWAMGRALWLRGRLDEPSSTELDTSVELSPNFALGHYTLAFVHSQSGDPRGGDRANRTIRAT